MTPEFEVERLAVPAGGDIAAAAAVEEEVFGRGGLNEWHLPVIARQGRLYAAKKDSKIVAIAAVVRSWDGSGAFVMDLAVSDKWRRMGAAGQLLSRIIKDMPGEEISRLELTVDPENKAALDLYRKCGFEISDTWRNEYGPGRDRLLLGLDLANAPR